MTSGLARRVGVWLLLVPVLPSACGKSVGETIDDATIAAKVKTVLQVNP